MKYEDNYITWCNACKTVQGRDTNIVPFPIVTPRLLAQGMANKRYFLHRAWLPTQDASCTGHGYQHQVLLAQGMATNTRCFLHRHGYQHKILLAQVWLTQDASCTGMATNTR